MGNVMVAPPKTELQRMRQVESQLTRQQNRIKSIARSENNRLARLQTKLANNMNKKRDCVNSLENQQISHEMAFIVHNQKSLTECFEHLTSLSRIVKQLKAGRFVQSMVRNVNTVVAGLDQQQQQAASSAPDAGMKDIISELARTRSVWQAQTENLQEMLVESPAEAAGEQGAAIAPDDAIRQIQVQILQEAEAAREEREALEDEKRDSRFRQLAERHAGVVVSPEAVSSLEASTQESGV